MRAFVFALASSFLFATTAGATPKRVASLNLCTDELLIMLGAPGQIASVTHLAHKPAETPLWKQGRRYRKNDGSLVSVAALRPDLVLTMGGGARDRMGIAKRLGIPTLDLPFPQTIGDVRDSVMKVARALGRETRGERIVARMDALRRSAPLQTADTIWLGGGGRSVAPSGLAAQWMELAGFHQRPLSGDRVSLEQLLVKPPAILLRSDYRSGQYSGEQRWLSHPLASGTRRSRTIRTDGRAWTCMGPLMIDEVRRLRASR
ncbi:ABC transporter substrate-binding protein [Sphingosinicella rhizophila]|uniref:ABC transporter substrate-binding protein n=1 Tax=Sphingosinicella rhizophila TaxID=3050082 RepID=A0ABU3Q3P8_9SPHN|nr:ABC transporter substrate-binding protein [Sphingosinicella sp. GR2756]MDT9597679.1 ABC transporter substrate-binding protein [Sphingosinicella sp. GR2756]